MKKLFKKIIRKTSNYEKPDPRPAKVLTGMNRPLSTAEHVRAVVQAEMSLAAQLNEMETFDEANDFDVDDDNMASQYTLADDDHAHLENTSFIEETPKTPDNSPEITDSSTPQPDSEPVDNSENVS